MPEKPFHRHSVQLNAPLWNIVPVPGKSLLVLEERHDVSRKVTFSAWDYEQRKFAWHNKPAAEPWWVNLSFVTPSHVWVKEFESTTNPDKTKWHALSIDTGEQVEIAEPETILHTNTLFHPFQFLAGEPDFETIKGFLKEKLGREALLGAEYREEYEHIFISYYHGAPAAFLNHLACFSKAGEMVWEEEIGMNLKGIGVNTFFLVSGNLFFVKNKTELVTYRIV